MSSKLRIAADIIHLHHGFPVPVIYDNLNSFYKIIGLELFGKNSRIRDARQSIFDFERSHSFYFRLFLLKTRRSNDFAQEVRLMNRPRQCPSLREIYAASEVLKKEINLILFTGSSGSDVDSFSGVTVSPVFTESTKINSEPLFLLTVLDQNGDPRFAKIENNHNNLPCRQFLQNQNHIQCLDQRFRNSFQNLTNMLLNTAAKHRDIYTLLSKFLYGNETHTSMLKTAIFDFEKEESNIEFFSRFLNLEKYFTRDRIKRAGDSGVGRLELLKEAKTRHMEEEVGDGELFAIASIFNIEIYIKEMEWTLYLPLTRDYDECFKSTIKILNNRGTLELLVPDNGSCLCTNIRPKVEGALSLLKAGSREFIFRVLERKTCCPGGRHCFHGHFKHIPGSKTTLDAITPYIYPFPSHIELAIDKLEIEERRLDQINGGEGTLEQCLSKELFGDENNMELIRSNIGSSTDQSADDYIQRASNWTRISIYLLYKSGWYKYQPDGNLCQDRGQHCRYYITLIYFPVEDSFVRIVPKAGCNCGLPPPLIIGTSPDNVPDIGSTLTTIPESQRHKPMVTFLSNEPQQAMFCDEKRCFPQLSSFSDIRLIFNRGDMQHRFLDKTEDHAFSLFRCISKEIFGTEKYFNIVLQDIVDEIKNNANVYGRFVRDRYTSYSANDRVRQEELFRNFGFFRGNLLDFIKPASYVEREEACFLADRIRDGLELEDLELLAAATCFQTPIYVLSVEVESDNDIKFHSIWRSFTQLRRKRKPPNFSTLRLKSVCQNETYFMTLYRSFTGQFFRICPRTGVCNCVDQQPEVPGKVEEKFYGKSTEDINFMKISRDMENSFTLLDMAISHWMRNAAALEKLCSEIIDIIEKRRETVNIGVMSGASVGVVGTAIVMLAPFTLGASIAVGVIAGAGGVTAAGFKITESVLNKNTVEQLDVYQKNFRERTCILQNRLQNLKENMETLSEFGNGIDLDGFANTFTRLRFSRDLTVTPFCVVKVAWRGLAVVSRVVAPLGFMIDTTNLLYSFYSWLNGSKTDLSVDLRKTVSLLQAIRIQIHVWAYGSLN